MRTASLREGVLLALDQLRANKFRSGLTVLGVVVGVATVMTMSALIAGIRSSVLEGIEAAGPKNFIVARFNWNDVRLVGAGSGPPWGDHPPITIDEAARLARLDRVERTIISFDLTGELDAGRQHLGDVQLLARDAGWSDFTVGTFTAGRDFLPAEVRASRPVIVLSRPLAEALFGSLDPVGRPIRVNGATFRVTGVFELGENIFASVVRHIAVLPYTAALKHLGTASPDMLSVSVITARDASQTEAMDQVIATLRTARGLRPADANNFALIRQEEMVETFNRMTGLFFVVMLALSSVALMVGGVGVIAIMMIAVTERTREIGIRKALGARRREILWQFLIEAATLTVAGAGIGLLIGMGAALLVQTTTPVPAQVPFPAIVAAIVMAAVAGVLFGLWPAWRAARLDPVVALRHE